MGRGLVLPKDTDKAERTLRLDAAIKAAGRDLAHVGEAIGLRTSGARSQWRQGDSPQLDKWERAAKELGVSDDWLLHGLGTPPRRVAECLAWIRSDPDLPSELRQESPVKPALSRRRSTTADLLRVAADDIESL